MIRINLAQSQFQMVKMEGGEEISLELGGSSEVQRQGAIRFLIMLIFPLLLYAYEFQNIPSLSSKLQSKNSHLQSLMQKNEQAKGAVEEIKKFKEDQARLQKQIDTLDGLQKERLREVKILDNLQKDIPEKVWLTRLDFQDKNLIMLGIAVADSELTVLMENLTKSIFFKQVNLVKSSEYPTDRGTFKKFEISCVIDKPVIAGTEVKK